MDIVAFKREMEQHRQHVERVRSQGPMVDNSVPSSLGLKHLAYRAKKVQLIEDRRQQVAKENRKLMERMTKIMADPRTQTNLSKAPSLNELSRRHIVDHVNVENRHMLDRLKSIKPMLNSSQLEKDFQKHQKASQLLRKRIMKPLSHYDKKQEETADPSTFDYSSYLSQNPSGASVLGGESTSPIRSMAEFRQHVITQKKLNKSLPAIVGGPSTSSVGRKAGTAEEFEMFHQPGK